jgi:sporulation protein YlmC with PRC-barrel domain
MFTGKSGGVRMAEERLRSRELIGKVLISEETGKKFGVVGDIDYVAESGELINFALVESTAHTSSLNLQQDNRSRLLVPFSAVKSVGDFVIVSEKDII